MFVEWTDTYATGIDLIDGHHRKLLALLNKSYILIPQENQQDELSQVLDELIDYTRYHFSAEEELMRENHYQHLDRHVIEHFSFINRVLSFKKEIREGRKYLSIDIFDFMKNWLLDHILKIDSELGTALREKPSM